MDKYTKQRMDKLKLTKEWKPDSTPVHEAIIVTFIMALSVAVLLIYLAFTNY
jgi:hypothetical protein